MGFKFQINRSIEFQENQKLIDKAIQYTPKILKKGITKYCLGKLVSDKTKLEGWTIVPQNSQTLSDQSYKKDDVFILDFQNHHVGNFSIDINSVGSPMDAPLYLRLRFAEVPAELAHQSSEYDGWLSRSWIQEEFIHIDELPTTLKLPRRYSFRYVEIKIIDTSAKWQAVFSNPKIETQSSVDIQEVKMPKLKDVELQNIYKIGVKTLADCMTDVFEDGPKRDRRLWLGDLRLQALANYVTFDKTDIVKRCLYLFAAKTTKDNRISANVFVKPQVIPDDTFLFDYSLFFITTIYDYLQYHEDLEILTDLYPIAKKQMDLVLEHFVDKNGKVVNDENYTVFVDWSDEFNKDTCAQAIVIYTLKQFIVLTEMLGKDVNEYKEKLTHLVEYTHNTLYDNDKKLFRTTNDEYNIASQVWMVLADILPQEENYIVMQNTVNAFFPVKGIATPYMYHYITEAMFKVGMTQEAILLMKNYWGQMVKLGADTFWEAFMPENPDYSPYGSPIISSYCHAWSCTPVYLINKYVL